MSPQASDTQEEKLKRNSLTELISTQQFEKVLMIKLCVASCVCIYVHTHTCTLKFYVCQKTSSFQTCAIVLSIRELFSQCSARKKCKFPISVTSMMGDAHLYISSPTPRKNECKCSNQQTLILGFKTLSAVLMITESTLKHSFARKELISD